MILYVYCAGGFGKEIMDVARRFNASAKRWNEIRFVDDGTVTENNEKYGAVVRRFEDIVSDGALQSSKFVIANGEPDIRRKILAKLDATGAQLGSVVDISSVMADSAVVEDGVVITPLCSISSNAYLARNACVNTMSIVGHDVQVGRNTVVSSMVNIGGACVIGDNSYLGMGALIKEGLRIGSNSIVGMGSVVYNDIPDGVIALGNPARVMRPNTDKKIFK